MVRKQRNTLRFATIRLKWKTGLRLISTLENYPWIGTDKKIFLGLVSSGLELMTLTQRKIFLSIPCQSTDNFPEWKLANNYDVVQRRSC